ncbi:zinc-ribbon domain-containing protein [Candidatus Bathyarchaeota archaeon]|nr:zinc-ribbon domain-containing protein [Candidatus Bathyarchaeota archaeon]
MVFCKKCGAKLKEDAKFCDSCGTPVIAEAKIRRRTMYTKEREACFGPPGSGGGLWGAISFGVFVVGLGILWLFDIFWPGILILIGIMVIIGAFVTLSRR